VNTVSEQMQAFERLFDLAGRVAVVAGGAGYLGSALCRGLFHHGANVVVADLNVAGAERLADELNGQGGGQKSRGVLLDIAREESIAGLIEGVCRDFGRLDVLVNATYAPQEKSLQDISGDDFTRSLGINISGTFLLARTAKLAMKTGGSIILFSSMYGSVAPDPGVYQAPMRPNPVEYGVAKAGIDQMVRYLAMSWARDGIRVNGVAPGPFPNPRVQESHPDFIARLAQKVPLGRIGTAGEIAGAVVFLASDAASYVTGQCLRVDGGWTIW
jgi:NAD(P)-dependent dehydrogenase (short-subunit alcohol dehydrogenase family)